MPDELPKRIDISESELEVVFSGPSYHVNRFFVTGMGSVLRLTFCEQDLGSAKHLGYRTSVVLQLHDAVALRNLLDEMVKPFEEAVMQVENGQK